MAQDGETLGQWILSFSKKIVHFVAVPGTVRAVVFRHEKLKIPGVKPAHQEETKEEVTSRPGGTAGRVVGHTGRSLE